MKFYPRLLITILFFIGTATSQAQRLGTSNTIGWFVSLNTIHLSPKLSVHLEYQWRRDGLITRWHQSLFRTGLQYHFSKDLTALLGYGYIISYPFGDHPAGPYPVPEHRIFEQLSWNDGIGRLGLNHRFRLEQRYTARIDQKATMEDVDGWIYTNRIRYQLRATLPIGRPKLQDKTWYLAAYDELFIGFGKNVNQNIFDQNRIGLLLGYQLNKNLRIEAGYLNQTVQQGGLVNGREVFQYNNGLLVNINFTKL